VVIVVYTNISKNKVIRQICIYNISWFTEKGKRACDYWSV